MTPMSESDRFCIYWLEQYKNTFGDAAPNATEYSLDQGTILTQYNINVNLLPVTTLSFQLHGSRYYSKPI